MADTIDGDSVQQLMFLMTSMLSDLPYFSILITLFLLLLSGLISGSEVAYFSLTAEQIKRCKNSEDATEKRVFKLLQNPKDLLATVLILNNLVNVAIVTLSTYISWDIASKMGMEKDAPIILFFMTVVVTAAVVFFGEIVPKVYASQRNLRFAKQVSGIISAAITMLSPMASGLTFLGDFVEKLLKKKKKIEVSVNELNEAVEIVTASEDTINAEEILKGIVNFGSMSVKQIMQSRMDIEAIDISMDYHHVMDRINKSGYSRIPVFVDSIDNIHGILYIKDLLPYLDEEEHFKWQDKVRRDTFFIPENKKIDELLRDFQEKRVHIAIIVDEYGGTTGLVTLEDIIEEIVGEINDEFDMPDEMGYKKLSDAKMVFDGKTSLLDFCKVTGVDPEIMGEAKGVSESLGGLMLELFRKMPNTGEQVSFSNLIFKVKAVDKKRIKMIEVTFKDRVTKTSKAKVHG
ncbi:gliding motility-associated protein GldE [Limibacter armeniacum]|uniref:gliding motility-associated protein GldE n=1 Tax=Limibacter armeniacum TaxID=466084 RepID=UPI002FE67C5C